MAKKITPSDTSATTTNSRLRIAGYVAALIKKESKPYPYKGKHSK